MSLERLGEGHRWREAARWLGLTPYHARTPIDECRDWDAMRAAVGNPMSASYATGDLMIGKHAGRNVMVALTEVLRETRDFDTGHTRYRVVGYRTHVVSAIEPALGVGLSLQPQGTSGGGAHLPDALVGHAALDPRYHIASADPERARTLLRAMRGPGWDAADVLVKLRDLAFELDVVDSYVRIWKPDRWLDPTTLRAWLDHATWLAGALAQARAAIPPAPYEEAYAEALSSAAAKLGLAVDRAALTMSGWLGHVGVRVYLGSVRGGVYTAVTATIPSPVACGLRVDREDGSGSSLVDWLTGEQRDVLVGVPAIDARLRIKGYPEAQVRWAVRAVGGKMLEVMARAGAFQIASGLVRVELCNIEMHPPSLVQAVDDAVAIARGLSAAPAVPAPRGPYR